MKLRFATSAEADLEMIGDWIARDDPQRALTFVRELRDACVILAEFPEICPLVARYEGKNVRRKVYGNYLILYTSDAASVTVIHIVHGVRDLDELLC